MTGPRSQSAEQALAVVEEIGLDVPRESLPRLLTAIDGVRNALFYRMLNQEPPDELLTARQAAPLVGVSHHTLLRNAKDYPFARQLSHEAPRPQGDDREDREAGTLHNPR